MQQLLSEDLLQELQIDKLPQEQQDATLERIGAILFESVMLRAADALPEGKQEEFAALLDSEKGNDPDALMDYLRNAMENFDELVGEEVLRFKAESKRFLTASEQGLEMNG